MAKLLRQADGEKFALVLNKEEFEAVSLYFNYTIYLSTKGADKLSPSQWETLGNVGEDIRRG